MSHVTREFAKQEELLNNTKPRNVANRWKKNYKMRTKMLAQSRDVQHYDANWYGMRASSSLVMAIVRPSSSYHIVRENVSQPVSILFFHV
jgi:hypothetical protein